MLLPLYEEKLEPQDRSLCHELTLGVLRRRIYLDRLIEKLTNKRKIDAEVRIILRMGIYQLRFLERIPAHAALNDAVNLTQRAKKTSAKGFVNAVLRRLTREDVEVDAPDEIEKLSIETSHPRWLLEKWIDQFGLEETAGLARENNQTPGSSFRWTAKTTDAVKQSLSRENIENEKNFLRELAAAGKIYFQERGSQLIAETVQLKENDKFLDLCAAPGSKTTFVANRKMAVDHQNFIVAGDFSWNRVAVLRDNCRRQGVGFVSILQYDAEKTLPFAEQSFDVVLVDAPCSGTGTIRHNPEIRYFLAEKDFAGLSGKQLGILENASKLIKPGGKLIYSTCSLEKEENETVCERFLAKTPGFEKVKPETPDQFLTGDGYARTFPQTDKMDGFFIAVFEKNRVFG